jgi:hypothetical protein
VSAPNVRVVHPDKPEKPVPKEILAEAMRRRSSSATGN